MTIPLTPSERHRAREIWHLMQEDDDSKAVEALGAAPENVRAAIREAAKVDRIGAEPEENPFL